MAWADRLLRGSFRGAPFHVEGHDSDGGGRRIALHEYPTRDKPFAEDLGRKAETFTIAVFVIGDDYQLERESLVAACDAPGSGLLVHPYRGVRNVMCAGRRISEVTNAGRMARLELSFVEAGSNDLPLALLNPVALVAQAVVGAQSAVAAAFAESFRT